MKTVARAHEDAGLVQRQPATGTTAVAGHRASIAQQERCQHMADTSARTRQLRAVAALADSRVAPAQLQHDQAGSGRLPLRLRHGIEALSGLDMSAVRVHRNSDKPAQLSAHAYAQGLDIHLGPGQEHQLAHEAWHVVQQAHGRVRPTMYAGVDGVAINDDATLEHEADVMGEQALHAGGAAAARQVAAAGMTRAQASGSVRQGKFYFGANALGRQNLLVQLGTELDSLLVKKASSRTAILQTLRDDLWQTYGRDGAPDMEMGAVVKAARRLGEPISKANVATLLQKIKALDASDVNTPENFKSRIDGDTRLKPATRQEYLSAFNDRLSDPGRYRLAKASVARERGRWVAANTKDADDELKQGEYVTSNHYEDFRSNALQPIFKEQTYRQLFKKLEKRVVAMGAQLSAAWYYNQKDDDKFGIFASHELQSYRTREKRQGKAVESKSMAVDTQDNKTGHYFYSFIEHEDSDFNENTRFTQEASADGVLGGAPDNTHGRRLRVPLRKMVKGGAIIMGGDLTDDRQEQLKMGLSQNATPNKLFGPAPATDELTGLLRNYVRFVERRVYEAMPYYISTFNPLRAYTKGELALTKLKTIDAMSDQEVWEYLVREIAQPQLLTPSIVSTSMKEMRKTDSSGASVP